jgi:phage-related minor tail protein
MGLQKSDAMMDKQVHLMPETPKLVMVFAAIIVIIAAVISMYP